MLTVLQSSAALPSRCLRITHNLDKALRDLRDQHSPRTLWVDGICINQADNAEKSSQIPLMAQIYQGASEVIAWLGEASPDADAAMSAVAVLSQEWTKEEAASQGRNHAGPAGAARMSSTEAFTYSEKVLKLLQQPWFRRVWIVQEVGMGGNRVTIQCGGKTARWDELVQACGIALLCGAARYSPVISDFVIMIDAARGKDACDIYERRQEASVDLLSLLCRYRQFDATNARDKVFALLNLAADDPITQDTRVLPDYSKGVASVYRDAAIAIMEGTTSLNILRVPIAERCTLQLPSWVPDWSRACLTMSLDATAFNTRAEFQPSPQVGDGIPFGVSADQSQLTIRVVHCPISIKTVGPALTRTDRPDTQMEISDFNQRCRTEADIILKWEDIADAQPRQHSKPYPCTGSAAQQDHATAGHETVGDAYRRTLLFGREYTLADGRETCNGDFRAWVDLLAGLRWLRHFSLGGFYTLGQLELGWRAVKNVLAGALFGSREELEYGGAARFADELAAAAVGRRFFVTEDGVFGMSPAGLEMGDTLVLVRGVNVPLVVRRAFSSPNGAETTWRLVGDCYMHSERIMQGRLWREGPEHDMILV